MSEDHTSEDLPPVFKLSVEELDALIAAGTPAHYATLRAALEDDDNIIMIEREPRPGSDARVFTPALIMSPSRQVVQVYMGGLDDAQRVAARHCMERRVAIGGALVEATDDVIPPEWEQERALVDQLLEPTHQLWSLEAFAMLDEGVQHLTHIVHALQQDPEASANLTGFDELLETIAQASAGFAPIRALIYQSP